MPVGCLLRELGQKVGVAALTTEPAAVQLIARSSREARAFADHADDAPHRAAPDLEVRAFAAPVGIPEDPVTGSLNAIIKPCLGTVAKVDTDQATSIAQFTQSSPRSRSGAVSPILLESNACPQGRAMQRPTAAAVTLPLCCHPSTPQRQCLASKGAL